MTPKIRNNLYVVIFGFLAALAGVTVWWHALDKEFKYGWQIFYIWLAILSVSFLVSASMVLLPLRHRIIFALRKEFWLLFAVLALAGITRFLYLSQYPFVSIGDELRDAGIWGMNIRYGNVKDIFDFGSYMGYGLVIPQIAQFFSLFMGFSVLTYRIPAALAGIGTILLAYATGRIIGGKRVALVSALLLIGSYISLHYARTELLVILDSFFTMMIIMAVYASIHHPAGFFIAGLTMGFAMNFYAGIRGVIGIAGIYFTVWFIRKLFSRAFPKSVGWVARASLLLLFGAIIGLGPRMYNFYSQDLFFRAGTASMQTDPAVLTLTPKDVVSLYYEKFEKAFLVYFSEGTSSHAPFKFSLLTFPTNWFFLAGLFYMLTNRSGLKHPLVRLLLLLIFLHPVTNQLSINHIGADHRLMGIVPVAVIIAAYGLSAFSQAALGKYSPVLLILIAGIASGCTTADYFISRYSDLDVNPKNYAFARIVNHIAAQPVDKKKTYHVYTLTGDAEQLFESTHYREKLRYQTYPRETDVTTPEDLKKQMEAPDKKHTEIRYYSIVPMPELVDYRKRTYTLTCKKEGWFNFACPLGFSGNDVFYEYSRVFPEARKL